MSLHATDAHTHTFPCVQVVASRIKSMYRSICHNLAELTEPPQDDGTRMWVVMGWWCWLLALTRPVLADMATQSSLWMQR